MNTTAIARTYEVRKSTINGRPTGQSPMNRRKESDKINTVIRIVCEHYGIAEDEMINSKRGQVEISWPRQVAMNMACEFTHFPTTSIGRRFHRDHGTVCYARIRVREQSDVDFRTRTEIEDVRARIFAALAPQPEKA